MQDCTVQNISIILGFDGMLAFYNVWFNHWIDENSPFIGKEVLVFESNSDGLFIRNKTQYDLSPTKVRFGDFEETEMTSDKIKEALLMHADRLDEGLSPINKPYFWIKWPASVPANKSVGLVEKHYSFFRDLEVLDYV
jgi:hypothetical protein